MRKAFECPRRKRRRSTWIRIQSLALLAMATPIWQTFALSIHSLRRHGARSLPLYRSSTPRSQWIAVSMTHSSHSNRVHQDPIPRHVAFICDGNSRWAQQNNCSTIQGHSKGADRLVELLETLQADGISYCTLFGFSTENWNRPSQEIQDIFRVMEQTARQLVPRLVQESHSIQVRILGDLQDDRIPYGLRTILQDLQTMTRSRSAMSHCNNKILTVCLAVNYGGRQDLVQATRKIAREVAAGRLSPDAINQDVLESFLTTAGIPDPDLIVRSSGEHRLSNFLLWNAAYAELYVTDVFWPDFDTASWKEALMWYQQRNRRFGTRSPPIVQVGASDDAQGHGSNS